MSAFMTVCDLGEAPVLPAEELQARKTFAAKLNADASKLEGEADEVQRRADRLHEQADDVEEEASVLRGRARAFRRAANGMTDTESPDMAAALWLLSHADELMLGGEARGWLREAMGDEEELLWALRRVSVLYQVALPTDFYPKVNVRKVGER